LTPAANLLSTTQAELVAKFAAGVAAAILPPCHGHHGKFATGVVDTSGEP
jgi:hypothetical protein